MTLLGEIRSRARHILGPLIGVTLFAYFAYHLVQGERGLIAWLKLSQQIQDAQLDYARLDAERAALARRVTLLQSASLDPDLLEERARAVLGVVRSDEVVIFTAGRISAASPPDMEPPPVLARPETPGSASRPIRISLSR